jgi:hypothetical protein
MKLEYTALIVFILIIGTILYFDRHGKKIPAKSEIITYCSGGDELTVDSNTKYTIQFEDSLVAFKLCNDTVYILKEGDFEVKKYVKTK